VPAAAEDRDHEGEHGTLLGLGDSVAFGYNPLLVPAQAGDPDKHHKGKVALQDAAHRPCLFLRNLASADS